jgi:L-amino acid N-acyltransferase YncA
VADVAEDLLIRPLVAADASLFQACRLIALEESGESFLVSRDEVARTQLAQVEAEMRDPDTHYLGAFRDGRLVGFMRFVRFARQSRRHVAEVRSVYVRRAERGRGVGTQLLRRLVDDAAACGLESLTLSVLADNTAARRLYEACGFHSFGTEPGGVRKADARIDLVYFVCRIMATDSRSP